MGKGFSMKEATGHSIIGIILMFVGQCAQRLRPQAFAPVNAARYFSFHLCSNPSMSPML